MTKFIKTAANRIPDGQYLIEFTAGERGAGSVVNIELIAEVLNGPAKGFQIGESLHFSFGPGAEGRGNERKLKDYGAALGVTKNHLDPEEWLFRPFTAGIQNGRIVTIRGETGDTVYLSAAGRLPRQRVLTDAFAWTWAHAWQLRPRRVSKRAAA